jgi:predicted dithiol-disulfide oxidoreductase (DUF899 family)
MQIEREIEAREEELLRKKKELTQLRRRLPQEEVRDYGFRGPDGTGIQLSQLFGGRDELILIHNMGKGCRYCTLWADGFNGVLPHLENRAAFAVISPDDPEIQKEFAASRGWKFKLFSGQGDTFIKDMGFEPQPRKYQPGVSTFRKNETGQIFRIARTYFGPGDDFCSIWHLFDLLPESGDEWSPQYSY